VVGLGLGLVATPTLISAQSSVSWNERGVVTSSNMFARSIGSALGVAVFGAVANAVYGNTAGEGDAPAVVAASGAVFLAALVGGILTVAAVLAMPAVKAGTADEAALADGQTGAKPNAQSNARPDAEPESSRSSADM
jgi:MFS family permease